MSTIHATGFPSTAPPKVFDVITRIEWSSQACRCTLQPMHEFAEQMHLDEATQRTTAYLKDRNEFLEEECETLRREVTETRRARKLADVAAVQAAEAYRSQTERYKQTLSDLETRNHALSDECAEHRDRSIRLANELEDLRINLRDLVSGEDDGD